MPNAESPQRQTWPAWRSGTAKNRSDSHFAGRAKSQLQQALLCLNTTLGVQGAGLGVLYGQPGVGRSDSRTAT